METTREQSEFNMAVSYLNRINSLFYVCDESAMALNISTWFNSLLTIYRELSTEMKKTEQEEQHKSMMLLFEKVNKHISKTNASGRAEVQPELYWELHNLELDLRKVLKESGLQQKMKDAASDALR
jgi:hypothetical protein